MPPLSSRSHEEIVTICKELNARRRFIGVFLTVAVMIFAVGFSAVAAKEEAASSSNTGNLLANAYSGEQCVHPQKPDTTIWDRRILRGTFTSLIFKNCVYYHHK
jgi:hypothetical protein